jgi:protein-S-isoprenylcysteine O-methyltransferase Ste14
VIDPLDPEQCVRQERNAMSELKMSAHLSRLRIVRVVRKAVLFVAVLGGLTTVVLGESRWPEGTPIHMTMDWIGVVLIVLCILGRTWCTLYIGGRKVRELVTFGPYSVSRNPLYLFSIIGATGVGAQTGSVLLALLAGSITWFVFFIVVRDEEKLMARRFGNLYRKYLMRVPRFLPNPSLWRDVETIEIRPTRVLHTFIDACVFLITIPVAEGLEYLHGNGHIPVLFRLP